MTTAARLMRVAVAFILGGVAYLVVLVGCLGSSPNSTLGDACSAIGPILRVPFLYVLPYADSRYLGVDAMLWATIGNAFVWGAALAIVTATMRRRTKTEPASS